MAQDIVAGNGRFRLRRAAGDLDQTLCVVLRQSQFFPAEVKSCGPLEKLADPRGLSQSLAELARACIECASLRCSPPVGQADDAQIFQIETELLLVALRSRLKLARALESIAQMRKRALIGTLDASLLGGL